MKPPRIPGQVERPAQVEAVAVPSAQRHLPDESEIDPASITTPVLTRQGWVCPVKQPGYRHPELDE